MRFVASVFVSGRLTVAAVAPGTPADEAGAAIGTDSVLEISAPSTHASTPRCSVMVTDARLDVSEIPQLRSIPLIGMPPAAAAALCAHATSQQHPWRSMERFVVDYTQEAPVSGFIVPTVFAARSLQQLLFADRFFEHWKTRCIQVAAVRASFAQTQAVLG